MTFSSAQCLRRSPAARGSRRRSPRAAADPPRCHDAARRRRSRVPHVAPARTAALAVDLRTGEVVYARNPDLALVPASNQKLPVAYAALALLGPGYRFHTEVVGSGTLVGDVWHGDLCAQGLRRPDALDAPTSTRSRPRSPPRGSGASTGRVDRRRVVLRRAPHGAGLEAELLHQRVAAALGARRSTALVPRRRTSASPALAAALAVPRRARAPPASRSRAHRTGGVLTTAADCRSRATSPSRSPTIVRFMDRESDNFTAEMLLKQLGAVRRRRGARRPPGRRRSAPRSARRGRPARRGADRRRLGPLAASTA